MFILHGGNRSPFVRRVAIWLKLQGRPFERRPIKLWGADFDSFVAINPLRRVPALTLPGGEHLIESAAIIDYLEDIAPLGKRLVPPTGDARRRCMQAIAHANAIAEKGVALMYEVERRPAQFLWPDYLARVTTQLESGLLALEAMLPETGWIGGDDPDGADIAAVVGYDFVGTISGFARPSLPRLAALSALANTHDAFSSTHPTRTI
ncbi:MAG: glutathione S-transferase family protein [Devosia sp.]